VITNGFRASHRNRWLFVKEGVLTIDEMVLLDFYIDKMNYSVKSEDAGTFDLDYEELKLFLHRGKSTISALNSSLMEKGFLKKINPNKFAITCWKRYILETAKGGGQAFHYEVEETNKSVERILQNLGINFQITGKIVNDLSEGAAGPNPLIKKLSKEININIQDTETKGEEKDGKENCSVDDKSSSLGSVSTTDPRLKNVAGQFPKWVLIVQELRTDKEYQDIQDAEADDMKMSIEDMKWIDQHAFKFEKVEDEEKEEWVINVYFDGDAAKYNKYLEPKEKGAIINLYP